MVGIYAVKISWNLHQVIKYHIPALQLFWFYFIVFPGYLLPVKGKNTSIGILACRKGDIKSCWPMNEVEARDLVLTMS